MNLMHVIIMDVLLSLVLIPFGNALAQETVGLELREDQFVSKVLTNGLTVALFATPTASNSIGSDFSIELLLKAPKSTHSIVFVPKKEYIARIEMENSSGAKIPKTRAGREFGTRFEEFKWGIDEFAQQPHSPVNVTDTWTPVYTFPPSAALFKFAESGSYRLKIRVQLLLFYLDSSKKQTRQALRVPELEISVVHALVVDGQ